MEMKPAKNWFRSNPLKGTFRIRALRCSMMFRSALVDPLMGAGQILVYGILLDKSVDLRTMKDKHVVQTFPFQRADNPLANSIGFGSPNRGP